MLFDDRLEWANEGRQTPSEYVETYGHEPPASSLRGTIPARDLRGVSPVADVVTKMAARIQLDCVPEPMVLTMGVTAIRRFTKQIAAVADAS